MAASEYRDRVTAAEYERDRPQQQQREADRVERDAVALRVVDLEVLCPVRPHDLEGAHEQGQMQIARAKSDRHQ